MRLVNQKPQKCQTGSVNGSALIMTVVLTVLLSVVAVMFVLVSNLDKAATDAVTENRELDAATKSIVTIIAKQLAADVPGEPNNPQEYYDYPDISNTFLANLEPYEAGGNFYWQQISDVTDVLGNNSKYVQAEIVGEQDEITDPNQNPIADADGDGVGDSKWVKLSDVTTSKGKPVYAAVRTVDNGAMLNVNTAYLFDATSKDASKIDGRSQMQINLAALSKRGAIDLNDPNDVKVINKLRKTRSGTEDPNDLNHYENIVVWTYDLLYASHAPFDIGDELELRNRFILNHTDIDARIEP